MTDFYHIEHKMPYCPAFYDGFNIPGRIGIWKSLLYELFFSAWEIVLPEGWTPSPFRYLLFGWGSLGVVWDDDLGWVYGYYGTETFDWQYNPLKFNVTLTYGNADPARANDTPIPAIRGLNGAVLHVRDNWTGFDAMISDYAQLLASADKGVQVNLKQSRYGKVIGVDDKKTAETIKQAIAKSDEGDPVVYLNKTLFGPDGRFNVQNLLGEISKEYFADSIMETRLMILKDFLTRVGVRNVSMEKREHLLNQEINENNDETGATPYVIMTSLKPELDLLNSMGCKISIKPRFDYSGAGVDKKEVQENGSK